MAAKEIVVTATRMKEEAFDVPYLTYTFGGEQIREQSYRTTPDVFRETPGVMVQKTAFSQGSPYIRGFTGYHTLMLIDGIRLNNSNFRSGPNQYWGTVDPLSVERYELIEGPGSALYGSDAVGGTLNAIMKGPRDYTDGFHWGGLLYGRWLSAERSYMGRFETWETFGRTAGVYVGGSMKDFGDLQGGRDVGRQEHTGYDERDLDFKFEYFPSKNTKVTVGHQTVRLVDAPRTHQTLWAKSWDGTIVGTDLKQVFTNTRELSYAQVDATDLGGFIDAARFSVSWQGQDEVRHRTRLPNREDVQGTSVGTLGALAQFESPTPIGHLCYGFDVYHDVVNSFSTANPIQGPVADDSDYDLVGLFLQDKVPLGERLEGIAGVRYDFARAEAGRFQDPVTGRQRSFEDDWEAWTGNGRLVYHVGKAGHWNVYGGVGQSFRAPNLSDLTRSDIARTRELEIPSTDLKPEHYISYEAGVKSEYDAFAMQLAYFYTTIEDMIIRVPTGRIIGGNTEVSKSNGGDGYVQGVEFSPSYRFLPEWTAFGGFTWMDGEVDGFPTASRAIKVREPLSRLMPTTTSAGLRWDEKKKRFWAEAVATFANSQRKLSSGDMLDTSRIPPGGTPGYNVLALRGGWNITPTSRLSAAVENVTNEDYRIHGSGLNEPGRNFIVSFEQRF